eukprot:2747395-Pleurochrysis_carterae.AAC.1
MSSPKQLRTNTGREKVELQDILSFPDIKNTMGITLRDEWVLSALNKSMREERMLKIRPLLEELNVARIDDLREMDSTSDLVKIFKYVVTEKRRETEFIIQDVRVLRGKLLLTSQLTNIRVLSRFDIGV